jgi:hypothetical protein
VRILAEGQLKENETLRALLGVVRSAQSGDTFTGGGHDELTGMDDDLWSRSLRLHRVSLGVMYQLWQDV